MDRLKDVINMVEVGMKIGLCNEENGCSFGGTVVKKILYHDSDTHEEHYEMTISVDGLEKEVTEIEKYRVYALFDRKHRDLLQVSMDDIRAFYFPDAYTDPVEVFCEMVEAWNYSDEYERAVMATILMERMNASVVRQIIDKMCNKRNALAVTLGLEDTEVFD